MLNKYYLQKVKKKKKEEAPEIKTCSLLRADSCPPQPSVGHIPSLLPWFLGCPDSLGRGRVRAASLGSRRGQVLAVKGQGKESCWVFPEVNKVNVFH